MGGEDASNSRIASGKDLQPGLVPPITRAHLDSAGTDVLPSTLSGQIHLVPPSSSSLESVIGCTLVPPKILSISNSTLDTVHAIESSGGSQLALIGEVANINPEDIKGKAQEFVLTRLRTIVSAYVARIPIVGSYLVNSNRGNGPDIEASASETTPLLSAIRDPKAFATGQAEGVLRRLLSPLLSRIPKDDALDNVESNNPGFYVLVECFALARDGGGWLFTYLHEHSLVIAPTVSLGHLSTTDLAASTIGTAITSITGYSIIEGFISSLDKHLATTSDRHAAKVACAQAAAVTGLFLFPITNLWTVHSPQVLLRLGQSPDVVSRVSEFLRVTAAGLPGYAISEISKRYLTSQGLSSVHTRILSVTAPLNLILNYLLVNGPIPALRLGFAGAPLCTVLSHNALAVMLIIYIVQRAIWEEAEYLRERNTVPDEPQRANSSVGGGSTGGIASHIYSDISFFTGLGALVFSGISGVLKNASQLWSKDFGGFVASVLGPDALATQAVLLTTATTLYQAPKALTSASSDRIKKWTAKGDTKRAKIAATVAFFGTLGATLAISNVLLAFATSWGKLFNSDPIIVESVSAVLPIIAIFQAVHGIGAWADSSLGALGKPAVFPSLNASADYFLGIPLGVYLALPRGWGLAGLWLGLSASLAYSCLVATIVLARANWKVTRERHRAENTQVQATVQPSSGASA